MTTLHVKVAVAIALLAAAPAARAHEFACEAGAGLVQLDAQGAQVLGDDGLPLLDVPAAPVLHLDRYPAVLAFRVQVDNLAGDPSVMTAFWSHLLDGRADTTHHGAAFGPGFTLPVGGSGVAIVTVPVPDQAACLALGGAESAGAALAALGPGAGPTCRADALHERVVVSHELGSSECRARFLCGAPAAAE